MNTNEVYKLACSGCERVIEIPAGPADKPEVRVCPHCGTRLLLEWRAKAA